MLKIHEETKKVAAAEQVAIQETAEKDLSLAVERARAEIENQMRVQITKERELREHAEEQARAKAKEAESKQAQVEAITAQSAKMAKEAAEFETCHALEEARRRADTRAESERWAREQVEAARSRTWIGGHTRPTMSSGTSVTFSRIRLSWSKTITCNSSEGCVTGRLISPSSLVHSGFCVIR